MRSERQARLPSAGSLTAIESILGDISPEGRELRDWHDSYVANHKVRVAHDLDIIRMHVDQNATVLECGSVPLLLTAAMSRAKYDMRGCDVAPERYASAITRAGLNVVKCNIEIERLPFADELFDAVVFNEIFEHLRINPIFTLSEVLRVMKPNGVLMLSTPNLRSLGGIVNFMLRGRAYSCTGNVYAEYEKLKTLGHMGHVREYTTREVVDFLEHVGFVVRKVIYRGQYGNRLGRLAIRSIYRLSPFVSYVAHKP